MLWIVLAVAAAIVAYAIYIYNRLVSLRQMTEEAWSGIDVQLKRRTDLIPNLVNTVKGYASHEREVLEDVTRLRTAAQAVPPGDVAGRAAASSSDPAAVSTVTTRNWNDLTYPVGDPRRGNFNPDCDMIDPAVNGECSQRILSPFGTLTSIAQFQSGYAVRVGQSTVQLGVLDQCAARTCAQARHRRRVLPALVR